MTWFKVDDTLNGHPKARAAGLPAMGLWALAGSYASQYLTDGYVPEWYVASWPQGKRLAARLVDVGLWDVDGDGWRFHQWDERQPSRQQVESERATTRTRVQKWRSNAVTEPVTEPVRTPYERPSNGVCTPAPTRPDLIKTTSMPRKRGSRLPEDWKPTTEDVAWQRGEGITDLLARREFEKFRDYWKARSGREAVKLDWSATWRNWLRNVKERQPQSTAERGEWFG